MKIVKTVLVVVIIGSLIIWFRCGNTYHIAKVFPFISGGRPNLLYTVISLAMAMIGVLGAESDSTIARGAVLLLPVAIVPMLILVGLRMAPQQLIALADWFLRPFPTHLQNTVHGLLGSFRSPTTG